ncbi:efflux RND transporter periplasmic adaptor subunit [soil metagenome]
MYRAPIYLVLFAALAIAPATTGCHRESQASEEAPHLLVTSPLRKDTELTKQYVAQIRAIQHIEVRALEKGYLQKVFVDEGQKVEAGNPMFQILPIVYQAEVQKAQAEADLTQIELGNTKILADKNVVSPNELSLANARLNRAKADVSLARTHQSLTELRAPFDGIVGRFQARLGSLVSEGDLLTTLSDNSKMWVYFNVSEAEYLKYEMHAQNEAALSVKLIMANGEQFDQPGKVETIEADFDNGTGNVAFRAGFLNPKGLLRHGETGKIVMTTVAKNALLIPQKATFDVLDQKFVYVVDEKGTIKSRSIKVSAELPHIFVVESGVDENDKILIDGLRKVRDGSTIGVVYKDPADVMAHLDVPAE